MFAYEKNILKLYHYHVLVHLDNEEIDVLYKHTTIHVRGRNLRISYFAKEEIHIEGNIQKIEMENHNDSK